jgi:hypothetical protein
MMNSTWLYPARAHGPKGRGILLGGGAAHDQCGLASAAHVVRTLGGHHAQSRCGSATPIGEPGAEA